MWEIESEDDCEAETPLDPARIYWSLTEEGNFGTDTIIKVPEMRRKDIDLADSESLRSFLLNEETIEYLKSGSIEKFRTSHRQILETWFAEFVVDRLGDQVDLRPEIEAIIARS